MLAVQVDVEQRAVPLPRGDISMAGFALSRYSFLGREGIFLLFAVGLLFPLNAASLPLYLLLDKVAC
jgi:ABC-type glycerol-3-phosphate transport system permease component